DQHASCSCRFFRPPTGQSRTIGAHEPRGQQLGRRTLSAGGVPRPRAGDDRTPSWRGKERARMATPASGPRAVAPHTVVVTHHRTATIDGVNIFYREAGPADGPAVLLLHGFPTSSHMFRNLIPVLADRYHVIAPDYPGYGQSDMPDRATFAYTFDHYAALIDELLDRLHVTRYAMYVMDYGAPVGWRLALKHPDRITGLI